MSRNRSRRENSRGVVSVEFALLAPIFVIMVAGLSQASYLFNAQNQFNIAAREGARIASHDRNGLLSEGTSTNDKIETDIRNFLTANNLPGDDVDVFISEPGNKSSSFDLDDPTNEFKYFQVMIEYPVNDMISVSPPGTDDFTIGAKLVFRNGRAAPTN